MDFGRFRGKLTSLAVSVMVTTAFLASPPGVVGAPQSAAASDAPGQILTADRQRKLMALRETHGHDVALGSRVTAALGISKGDEVLTLRQLTFGKHPIFHSYIPLPDGGVMLVFVDAAAAWSYRLNARLMLIAAVSANGGAPIVIPTPDAERNVQTELAFWAALADRH
jgi:hypothetical protein